MDFEDYALFIEKGGIDLERYIKGRNISPE